MEIKICRPSTSGTIISLIGACRSSAERKAFGKALKTFGRHLQLVAETDTGITYAVRGCVPTSNWLSEVSGKFPYIKVVKE